MFLFCSYSASNAVPGGVDILLAGLPNLKLRKARQPHGDALPPEGHAAVQHLLAGKVERPGTSLGGKGGDVGSRYACAYQYFHFLSGSFHQLPQQGSTLRGACGLSAGQNGGKPQLLCSLQRGKGAAANIKGAVQGASLRCGALFLLPAGLRRR